MDRMSVHVVLSDSVGATWGVLLLSAISVGLGFLVYVLLKRLASRGATGKDANAGRRAGLVLGGITALGIFAVFYASSLAGFYDLQVRDDQVVLHYLFPERYVTRLAANVLKVEQEPAFQSKWRLVVHDVDGGVYQSALSSRQEVEQALTVLQPVVEPDSAPRPEQ